MYNWFIYTRRGSVSLNKYKGKRNSDQTERERKIVKTMSVQMFFTKCKEDYFGKKIHNLYSFYFTVVSRGDDSPFLP